MHTLVEMEVSSVRAQVFGNDPLNARAGLVLYHAALALYRANLFNEAKPLAEEAYALYEQHPAWPETVRQHALELCALVLSRLGDHAAVEPLQRKLVDRLRTKLPAEDPELGAAVANLTYDLMVQQKFSEAEAPARESMAISEKSAPDDWRTFNSRSILGASLLGQKKYSEAEPLLLSGYEGMKQREKSIPPRSKPRLREVLRNLSELYDGIGQTERAAEWKKKVAEFDEVGTTPAHAGSER